MPRKWRNWRKYRHRAIATLQQANEYHLTFYRHRAREKASLQTYRTLLHIVVSREALVLRTIIM